MLLRTRPDTSIKHSADYRVVRRMERIQHRLPIHFVIVLTLKPVSSTYLHVELPYLHKERSNPLVVLGLMEQHKLHVLSSS